MKDEDNQKTNSNQNRSVCHRGSGTACHWWKHDKTRPPPVTENRLVNVTPENLEPAQPDIANLLDMINMGE